MKETVEEVSFTFWPSSHLRGWALDRSQTAHKGILCGDGQSHGVAKERAILEHPPVVNKFRVKFTSSNLIQTCQHADHEGSRHGNCVLRLLQHHFIPFSQLKHKAATDYTYSTCRWAKCSLLWLHPKSQHF